MPYTRFLLKNPLRGKFSIAFVVGLFYLVIAFLTRLILFISVVRGGFKPGTATEVFLIGFVYDLLISICLIIPFVLHLAIQSDFIYRRKIFPYVMIIFLFVITLLLFTDIVPRDFSPVLHTALLAYIILRLGIYILLYVKPITFRVSWRKTVIYIGLTIFIFLLTMNAVSEWFFWNEFLSRYNFIAVDYLVYTNEVLGNIRESYPITWILSGVVVGCAFITYWFKSYVTISATRSQDVAGRIGTGVLLFSVAAIGLLTVGEGMRHFSNNEYANSLAGNGIFEFGVAYQENELSFTKFYKTMPDSTAFSIVRDDLKSSNVKFVGNNPLSIEREVSYPGTEKNYNVVLISVESLSASYMSAFGDTNNITPNLDSLVGKSLFFTNMFASGTRTVRGLEALSLSIPPTPGESTIKRPDNAHLFSLGSVLKSKGYTTQFLYGGYSYFDNMKDFYSGNNYTVIDRSAIPASQIHYQNIWGVADEDLFGLALRTFDADNLTGKPFFAQIMTVSNHRPYTYPEGRIDISPSTKTRFGAVKYTDYAIGQFLRNVSKKPWFKNTVFVIVADHCAGSSGNVELPVTDYHIPMLIYAPGIVAPGKSDAVSAQIDVAPTILGILNVSYRSKFFGKDLRNPEPGKHRAFISTYEGLGYLKNGNLLIQSPVKKINQFKPDFITGNSTEVSVDQKLASQAIAYYQCAAWLLENKKQSDHGE